MVFDLTVNAAESTFGAGLDDNAARFTGECVEGRQHVRLICDGNDLVIVGQKPVQIRQRWD